MNQPVQSSPFYIFTWRRRFLWKTLNVITHRYDSHQDKLVAFRYPDGGLFEIKNWSQCEARLGKDWVDALQAQKAAMPVAGPMQAVAAKPVI